MPFKSKAQMRACFARHDKNWDCHKWAHETPDTKKLPERKRKKQQGGSVQDYLTKQGVNGSYRSRKEMFNNLFQGKYKGTAEQNTQLLQMLQSGKASIPGKEAPLESGVIVNKGNNTASIVRNFKPVKTGPVITGMNPQGEDNTKLLGEVQQDPQHLAATPKGDYFMSPGFVKEYSNYGMNMIPLANSQGVKPAATDLWMHTVHPGRTLGDANDYESMGCINCGSDFMNEVQRNFPLGDTLRVVNQPNMLRGKNKKQYGGTPGATKNLNELIQWTTLQNNLFDPNQMNRRQIPRSFIDQMSPEDQLGIPNGPAGRTTSIPTMATPTFQGPAMASHTNIVAPPALGSPDAAAEDSATQRKRKSLQSLGIGIQGASDVLSEISGRIARNRQNQYMYNQLSTLGQMNAMPVEDYQPNPFRLYSQYGGSIKKYQKGGFRVPVSPLEGITPTAQANLTPRYIGMRPDANAIDSSNYRDAFFMNPRWVDSRLITPSAVNMINSTQPEQAANWHNVTANFSNGAQDVMQQMTDASSRPPAAPVPTFWKTKRLKKGGWIKDAVNPEHKGYCTPMTKSTCTGHRKAFAKMMKKKHGFHKD
jgi:hypothetical protein